ncbi:phospholipase A2-esterase protein [Marine Group I thaumarchaeote SCGC AAA799-B03]|uniref:Phospholipase A2-esterase protein n=3 Tax=Marine Group I TaxID=905826 RepID=A0A087S6X3_9ARCH|nr:phospholipase A2-esterase protein [Marine Group I thaumarchaeote SCGC AAA799-N04]KFM19203.1 hypothetical protein SCCGRSA3_00788 [Marine Group I thaumarchaeote SCGC RSA3]KFM21477.1 phospholipase A2-esterase protein [Marine Group I thaumarchaeote SCGC AAA799-B03]
MSVILDVEFGLNYLLNHFNLPLWPRRIQAGSKSPQIIVNSVNEALENFKKADFIDCRINAFSEHEIESVTPNCIFIDLDKKHVLSEVVSIFHKTLGTSPLVLSTGNGFAIVLPIEFNSLKHVIHQGIGGYELSTYILRFMKEYLSNNHADSSNHPSLKSCLIRIPYSKNQKCIESGKNNLVTIKHEWDGRRVTVKHLPFTSFLDEIISQKKNSKICRKANSKNFVWIDKLLSSQIKDGRSRLLFDVTRYLINLKGKSIEDTVNIVHPWINSRYYSKNMIQYECRRALKDGKYPRRLNTIKNSDVELYDIIS